MRHQFVRRKHYEINYLSKHREYSLAKPITQIDPIWMQSEEDCIRVGLLNYDNFRAHMDKFYTICHVGILFSKDNPTKILGLSFLFGGRKR